MTNLEFDDNAASHRNGIGKDDLTSSFDRRNDGQRSEFVFVARAKHR